MQVLIKIHNTVLNSNSHFPGTFRLGPGTHIYKVDISRAFRHLKIDPKFKDYWDQQLLELIEFGFPLGFNRNCKLTSDGKITLLPANFLLISKYI